MQGDNVYKKPKMLHNSIYWLNNKEKLYYWLEEPLHRHAATNSATRMGPQDYSFNQAVF
jgi:hypothetical protein